MKEFLNHKKNDFTKEKINSFQSSINKYIKELIEILEKYRGKNVVGFGAPMRLATITNFKKNQSRFSLIHCR